MNDATSNLPTRRLILRPYELCDAADVQRLAGVREVADGALSIPHPYLAGMAEGWIAGHADGFLRGTSVTFAVTLRQEGRLVGTVDLAIVRQHDQAELAYWIGLEFWNQGYATEAAGRLIQHGFEALGLHRIQARHFVRNAASGRVMQKLGMRHEGTIRGGIKKAGVYEDLELYALLAGELTGAR